MIEGSGVTLSALKGFEKKAAVSAHNVANMESEGYRSQKAVLTEGFGSSVEVEISLAQDLKPFPEGTQGSTPAVREPSDVDLGRELPETALTCTCYEANLKVVTTRDEMLGSILDLIG